MFPAFPCGKMFLDEVHELARRPRVATPRPSYEPRPDPDSGPNECSIVQLGVDGKPPVRGRSGPDRPRRAIRRRAGQRFRTVTRQASDRGHPSPEPEASLRTFTFAQVEEHLTRGRGRAGRSFAAIPGSEVVSPATDSPTHGPQEDEYQPDY